MLTTLFSRARKGAGLVLACALAASLSLGAFALPAHAEVRKADLIMGQSVEARGLSVSSAPSIDAAYAMVVDADGTVYFERDADTETKIASITKVMTAIVALDEAQEGTTVTVSATAAAVGESSAELLEGDVLSLPDAIKALLVMSGNDAAEAIAETVGGQLLEAQGQASSDPATCVEAFVAAMNDKAAEIGMEHSLFCNPHGLDDGEYTGDHHSTARDVATMVSYAMRNQTFRDSVDSPTDTITVQRDGAEATLTLESTDLMLGEYEGACGVKTGFTDAAGNCFAGAVNRGAGDVYAIVLHSTDETQRFTDTEALFDWYFEHCVTYQLAHAPQTVSTTINGQAGEYPLMADVALADWVDKTVPATIADPSAAVDVFDLDGNVSQEASYETVSGNVHAGDKVGTLTFKQRNEVIATVDLVAAQDATAPGFLEGIGIWWDRFFRSFSGAPAQAESVLYNTTPLIVDKTTASAS